MKVKVVPYDPRWKEIFQELHSELHLLLRDLSPKIEHIGSTSVDGLWAKPVVDILIGIDEERLDETIPKLLPAPYIYIETFTEGMPERRFFIRMKEKEGYPKVIRDSAEINDRINDHKIAHLHIVGHKGPFWERHIAFRDYLRNHEEVRRQYQQLKQELSSHEWNHAFEFNEGKNEFIQQHEAKALAWYRSQQHGSSK